MKLCLLASGSSGNAIYVEAGATKMLIDAGLTGKQIEERLRSIGVDASDLQKIAVSHEHSDHIRGAGVLARRYRFPVWMTQGTLDASKDVFRGAARVQVFENSKAFSVGDLHFQPFALSHDAADPVNFSVSNGAARVGVVTDTGRVTQLAYQRLRGSDLVVIEANHDRDMLMNGRYPWFLKQRISSSHGHLPNYRTAETLCRLAEDGLRQAVLAHLSEENNRPDLAEDTCRAGLREQGMRDFVLTVAGRERPSPVFEL